MVVACFANNPADTYDVILMDVLMPKMNGHQAARAIRAMSKERPDAAKIPIIAQSANAFKEDVQASLDSGMNGHISKPFNIDAVTTAIKQNRLFCKPPDILVVNSSTFAESKQLKLHEVKALVII